MTTNANANVKVVTIIDLWNIFVHRLWIMILAAIVAAGGLLIIRQMTFVPAYSSTATLYILRQSEATSTGDSDSDFSLALKVVSDCDYLLKSHSVLDKVIQELSLETDYETLSKCVTTSNPENTRILEVTVKSDSPENAKQIVDAICEIGKEQITEAMGFQQVNLYEYGTLNAKPCNITRKMTYLLVGMIAAVLVYSVYLIIYLLDDRIRTEEDIERYLGLNVLGDIPNADEKRSRQYGYCKAYSVYGQEKSRKKRRAK